MKKIKFSTDIETGRLSESDAKRYFSRFGWFTFAFSIILLVVQIVLSVLIAKFVPTWIDHPLFADIFSIVLLYVISFPLAYIILAPLPSVKPVKEKLGFGSILGMLCICQALMWAGNFVSTLILNTFDSLLGGINLENPVAEMIDGQSVWITMLFTVILGPILEELFFRGLVCKKLLSLGEGYAVVLSSAFFALCHGNFFQLFYAFTVGCFFGFIYIKTGKLLYTVICHICVNFLGTVVATYLLELVDLDSLMSENPVITPQNITGLLVFLLYELALLAIIGIGVFLIVKNFKRIRFDEGLLPPPKGAAGASCLFLNFGVAAAIAIYAFTLIASLIQIN